MERQYRPLDYYVKGMHMDSQRNIERELWKPHFAGMGRCVLFKLMGHPEKIRHLTPDNVDKILADMQRSFEKINQECEELGFKGIFENPKDLITCCNMRDKLVTYEYESKCNEIVGCKSFEDYQPERIPQKNREM